MTLSAADLWQEHKTRLHNYIARRVPDRHVADDILQDVFLKVHTSLGTVKAPGSVAAWLYRLASNAIADYYRTYKPSDELPENLAAPEKRRDYTAELASCLRPFIDDLPEKYRTALVLSEIEGITQKEVARRLGLSVSGAKSRVQRGREKLRGLLSECCEIEVGRNGIVGYEVRNARRNSACKCHNA